VHCIRLDLALKNDRAGVSRNNICKDDSTLPIFALELVDHV
jgi:hypothetical protein